MRAIMIASLHFLYHTKTQIRRSNVSNCYFFIFVMFIAVESEKSLVVLSSSLFLYFIWIEYYSSKSNVLLRVSFSSVLLQDEAKYDRP